MTIDRGTHLGIDWARVSMPKMPRGLATKATEARQSDDVVILACHGRGPDDAQVAAWAAAKHVYYSHHFTPDIGLRPFDEAAAFPDARVTYFGHTFYHFDATAWAKEVLDVPEGIDLTIDHNMWRKRLHASARTLRDGVEADVRRKVDEKAPFVEAMAAHLGYFARNCPRIPAEGGGLVACGIHVNALLRSLTGIGVDRVREWEGLAATRRAGPLSLPLVMLPVDGVAKAALKCSDSSALALLDVTLKGGHRIQDDQQGVTVTVETQLPSAAVTALKGRDLSDVLDAPWLRGLTIRTARIEGGKVVIRAAAPREAMAPPRDAVDDDAAVDAALARLTGTEGEITLCDEDARPALSQLTRRQLLSVLSVLLEDGRAHLDQHGLPGWTLKRMGKSVECERCPGGPIADLVAAAPVTR